MVEVTVVLVVRLAFAVGVSFLVGEALIRTISRTAKRARLSKSVVRNVREAITAL
jgi:hypothetical protein